MDVKQFWRIIEESRRRAKGDQAAQADALYDLVERVAPDEVVSFDEHFRNCMYAANRTDLLAAATVIDGFWASTDAFQDFRSWLVSQGQEIFEAALQDPNNLADVLEPDDNFEFEEFCYIAGRV
jgi:hypothetical protein